MGRMTYHDIKVRAEDTIRFIELQRSTLGGRLIEECGRALEECESEATVVVLSGANPEVFCFGADFDGIASQGPDQEQHTLRAAMLYDVWMKLAVGPYVTIAYVRGKANAGGMGFVAAADIVLADTTAKFSLSELLFGLYPACVLPFLVRKIGWQKAHYLTLSTQPIDVAQALSWGLVDAQEPKGDALLRRHLLRLRRITKPAIRRYKAYMSELQGFPPRTRERAVAGNLEVFSDPSNLRAIIRYAQTGLFPWDA
jgi:polyketide biosynthesis enoyl-CoA hydratase PksH